MSHSEDNVRDNEAQNGEPQMSSQQQYLLEEEKKNTEETAIALDIEREKRNQLRREIAELTKNYLARKNKA